MSLVGRRIRNGENKRVGEPFTQRHGGGGGGDRDLGQGQTRVDKCWDPWFYAEDGL